MLKSVIPKTATEEKLKHNVALELFESLSRVAGLLEPTQLVLGEGGINRCMTEYRGNRKNEQI